jgi:dipeptidyl aminopeptidase/acylaminoacyl peptidase
MRSRPSATSACPPTGGRSRSSCESKPLTSGRWDDGDPVWSPDGRLIAFVSNRSDDPDANDNSDVWIADVQSGETRRLTTNEGSDDNPAWSPDGRSIAYVHTPVDPPVYATPRLMVVSVRLKPDTTGNVAGGAMEPAPRDLTGRLDRVPLPQSEQMYVALRSLGKAAARVIYPGQSHGISRPSYLVDRLRRYGLWYDKYVLGKDVDPTYEVWKEKKKTETP